MPNEPGTPPAPIFPQAAFDIVVIAASAGGLQAISVVLGGLPDSFPAPIAVVQHLDPRHRSLMAEILQRRSGLHIKQAQAGERLCPATVYVAPPNLHLLINPGLVVGLAETELVHFVRPSADLLFESAAACCRARTLGVVLTGNGSDGNMGVRAINRVGGKVIVQDPADAEFPGMPQAALASGRADLVLPLAGIPEQLARLIQP
jgi:two-component system chemotaxis response regulator CheB